MSIEWVRIVQVGYALFFLHMFYIRSPLFLIDVFWYDLMRKDHRMSMTYLIKGNKMNLPHHDEERSSMKKLKDKRVKKDKLIR